MLYLFNHYDKIQTKLVMLKACCVEFVKKTTGGLTIISKAVQMYPPVSIPHCCHGNSQPKRCRAAPLAKHHVCTHHIAGVASLQSPCPTSMHKGRAKDRKIRVQLERANRKDALENVERQSEACCDNMEEKFREEKGMPSESQDVYNHL